MPDVQRARHELHAEGAVRGGPEEDAGARDRLQDRRQAENRCRPGPLGNDQNHLFGHNAKTALSEAAFRADPSNRCHFPLGCLILEIF